MIVLSLFDGISCGKLALQRANIPITKYYASEIEKSSIDVSIANHPDVLRLGDVRNVKAVDVDKIDLLIGGSPCQSFSNAGDRTGFDGKSGLFYEFVRVLREVKPKFFLLENVKMRQDWQDIITKELEVSPIEIDSALVSAQQRKRLYWTNINLSNLNIQDKGLIIADLLKISHLVNKRENKIVMTKSEFDVEVRKYFVNKSLLAMTLRSAKRNSKKSNQEIATYCNVPLTQVEHWFRTDDSFSIPPREIWFKLKECINYQHVVFDRDVTTFETKKATFDMSKRIYNISGKHPTLTTLTGEHQRATITDGKEMFYLQPEHAEMLQTLPVGYTQMLPTTKRFKVIGNGWTVDILAEIFKQILIHDSPIPPNAKASGILGGDL